MVYHQVNFHSIMPVSFLVMNIFSQKIRSPGSRVASTLKVEGLVSVYRMTRANGI